MIEVPTTEVSLRSTGEFGLHRVLRGGWWERKEEEELKGIGSLTVVVGESGSVTLGSPVGSK